MHYNLIIDIKHINKMKDYRNDFVEFPSIVDSIKMCILISFSITYKFTIVIAIDVLIPLLYEYKCMRWSI